MEPLLAAYLADPSDTQPRVVVLDSSRFGYVEPIYVKSLCLTCHGDNVAPAVREVIVELYPNDEAVGFQAGDFRGMFWVTMPLAQPED
jgi:hypothetical protein